MAVTRAWVAAEMARRLGTILTAAAIGPSPTEAGELKEPIDDALRMLGVAEDDLATDEFPDAAGALALVKLTTLKAAHAKIATRFDIGRQGTSLRLQQTVATLERMIKAAEADVVAIFGAIPVGNTDDGGIFFLDLGYLTDATHGEVSRDWPYTTIGVGDG
jgi:hypothetical protein